MLRGASGPPAYEKGGDPAQTPRNVPGNSLYTIYNYVYIQIFWEKLL